MNRRFLFVIAAVAVLVGLFFAVKPDAKEATSVSTPNSTAKTFTLVVKGRKLVSGPETLHATQGDTVTIKIIADEDEELHLHGYDKMVDLTPGKQEELSFIADVSGHFPYELEHSKTEIGALEVAPK